MFFKGVIIVAGLILIAMSAVVLFSYDFGEFSSQLDELPIDSQLTETESKMITSPWAGEQTREIKSLSARELFGIQKGHGVGMALPAELNGYPGPRHALDMAEDLDLTSKQKEQLETLYQEMLQQSIPLGEKFIEIEREINEKFENKSITSQKLSELLQKSSEIQWQLRNVHLQAHLETADVLNSEQISAYNQLRGYTSGNPCENIPKGHDPEMWKLHHDCE